MISDKSSFPFITFLNTNVVVAPSNIEFGEICSFFESIDKFLDERKGILVLNGHFVQSAIILNGSKCPVLFLDEEERRSHWQL